MLQFEKSPGGIATITLNNPAKLNAFDNVMLADWAAALQESQADDAVAVVIVTGAGRAFCSGGDLGTMGEVDGNAALYIGDYLRNHVHPVACRRRCRSPTSAPSTVWPPAPAWTWL
ncbi:MAG: enoyl-CoA hydratase-related protein [Acidimicrobiales bacterium]